MIPKRVLAAALPGLLGTTTPALAAPPSVVADTPPVPSVVAAVVDGAGTPDLIVPAGALPHASALRPAHARRLEDAKVVPWIGDRLSPWLGDAIGSLAPDAVTVSLIDTDGLVLREVRAGDAFDSHDHDHGLDDQAGGHDVHAEKHDDAHSGHDDEHFEHAHAEGAEDGDDDDHPDEAAEAVNMAADHDEGHGHAQRVNAHVWLDRRNAIATAAAGARADADTEKADLYRASAPAFPEEMTALEAEVSVIVAPVADRTFVALDDAWYHVGERFDLQAFGSIATGEADRLSAKRAAKTRDRIVEASVTCVVAGPQYAPALVKTVIDGTDVRTGTLDPIGVGQKPSASIYSEAMRSIPTDMAACLGG